MGGFSVAYSLFSSVGKFAGPPRRGFWSGFFHPLPGAPLLGRLSVVPAARLTAVSLAHGLAFGGLPCGGGLPHGVLMVAGFPLLRAGMSTPSHLPWPFLD